MTFSVFSCALIRCIRPPPVQDLCAVNLDKQNVRIKRAMKNSFPIGCASHYLDQNKAHIPYELIQKPFLKSYTHVNIGMLYSNAVAVLLLIKCILAKLAQERSAQPIICRFDGYPDCFTVFSLFQFFSSFSYRYFFLFS